MGDYHTALKSLYPINPNSPSTLFAPKIAGCNINLFYYTGFCYLMLKRYSDATRSFNSILMFINLVKQYHARSAQYDQILQKNEQMYALLAITVSLSPASSKLLDENVATQLRERNAEKISKMTKGDIDTYDDLFVYSAPRFIPTKENDERKSLQLKLFLSEVKSTQTHPLLKQYLILYSSISLSKLSSLMDLDEDTLRKQLMCLKSKAYGLQWDGGLDATSGTLASSSDIDFHLDVDPASGKEMVIVSESAQAQSQARSHTDLLAKHIIKFEEILRDLEGGSAPTVPPPAHPRVAAF
jgi:translation initiation factor 3 subunit L